MKREATISADGLHRYDLTRTVQAGCPCVRCTEYRAQSILSLRSGYVLWVLCNPSTADAETDDATERRGWGFSNVWGYGKFVFVNTNPFRATDPKKARVPDETTLAANDLWLIHHAQAASVVVCAWGTNADPILAARATRIVRAKANVPVCALALTKNGTPKHPLYLPGTSIPRQF